MDPNDNRGDDDGPPLLVDLPETQEETEQPRDPKDINIPRVPITIVTGKLFTTSISYRMKH